MSRVKTHVKKGDTVVVTTGESKGSQGTVLEVLPAKGRVIVEGVNMIKKAIKPSQQNQNGGFQEKEASIAISNVKKVDAPAKTAKKKVAKKKAKA
ncbi:50S ribosomal protein L24 [Prosthecobacter sp.]|jgi:large subunit ribosomal protein L24|uniref:50S ribosomal protein L24 n=1 Tax=Prosthecobacter sp. TaxID=1965333 RepID=UPI00378463A6